MGSFSVEIGVGDIRAERWTTMDALVDTGAFMTAVPASILNSLGVTPFGKRRVRLGDGRVKEMDYGQTWIRVDGQEIVTFILFNEEGSTPALGAYTLEGLLLVVDPVDQQLIPLEEIHI